MKVFYDAQIFTWQKFGGISRYFVELMTHLPKDVEFDNSILLSNNVYLRGAEGNITKGINVPDFKGRARLILPINQFKNKIDLSRGKFDVFHPTYYDPYFLKHLKRPYVITVHDMIHELFPYDNAAHRRTVEEKKVSIRNADKIIAISQNTKSDLINLYNIDERKIEVVNLGHSVNANVAEPVEGLPKNYILFVGQRGGYKNFERFAKAFSIINRAEPDIKLVCTGGAFTQAELTLLQSLGIENEVVRMFVSDAQLTYIYRNALCFVFPSQYEGFGIPILEAFASGCPLALSNASCFPEIAKDGGAYFDPNQEESMAEVIMNIIHDSEYRQQLTKRGTEVLSLYSWDKMAREITEVYRSVVK